MSSKDTFRQIKGDTYYDKFFKKMNANEEHQSLIDVVQKYPEIFFRGPFLKLNLKKKKKNEDNFKLKFPNTFL